MQKRWEKLSARGESPFTQLPYVDPKVYEDVTLKFRDLFEEKKFELEALKCKQYFKGIKTTNQYFSTYNPQDLFTVLIQFVKDSMKISFNDEYFEVLIED